MFLLARRTKLDSVPEVTMSTSDCAPIATLTDGFTFAYLKEAFVATLFSLLQQREDELSNDQPSSNGQPSPPSSIEPPSAFLHAFETQVTTLKEQMADAAKSNDEGEKKAEKNEDEEEEGKKPCPGCKNCEDR